MDNEEYLNLLWMLSDSTAIYNIHILLILLAACGIFNLCAAISESVEYFRWMKDNFWEDVMHE